jgi:hypothetical protein
MRCVPLKASLRIFQHWRSARKYVAMSVHVERLACKPQQQLLNSRLSASSQPSFSSFSVSPELGKHAKWRPEACKNVVWWGLPQTGPHQLFGQLCYDQNGSSFHHPIFEEMSTLPKAGNIVRSGARSLATDGSGPALPGKGGMQRRSPASQQEEAAPVSNSSSLRGYRNWRQSENGKLRISHLRYRFVFKYAASIIHLPSVLDLMNGRSPLRPWQSVTSGTMTRTQFRKQCCLPGSLKDSTSYHGALMYRIVIWKRWYESNIERSLCADFIDALPCDALTVLGVYIRFLDCQSIVSCTFLNHIHFCLDPLSHSCLIATTLISKGSTFSQSNCRECHTAWRL